jgi:hypothetical protein
MDISCLILFPKRLESPGWDPPTPYLIENSRKNCMKWGSGRGVTTETSLRMQIFSDGKITL